MDHNMDFVEIQPEEPPGFDHLKALVHQGGRIDRDALTHLPIWMRQGLLGSHGSEIGDGSLAEGAARRRENQALHFAMFAGAKALMDGVVLAIHRQQRHVVSLDACHHYFACGYQNFLIGKGNVFAALYGFVGGGKTDHADGGGQDGFRVGMSGHTFDAFGAEEDFDRGAFVMALEAGAEFARGAFGGDGDNFRVVADNLFGDQFNVGTGGQGDDFEAARKRFDDAEALASDGAGGTEDGDALHEPFDFIGVSKILRMTTGGEIRQSAVWGISAGLELRRLHCMNLRIDGSEARVLQRFAAYFLIAALLLLAIPAQAHAQKARDWKTGVDYALDELVEYNGVTYRCIRAHTSDNTLRPADSPEVWQPMNNSSACGAVPDAPTGLSTFGTKSNATSLSWKPAKAPPSCVVTSYTVYQDGVSIAVVSTTMFDVRHLSPATQYTFTVTAKDSAGVSPVSADAAMTTKALTSCTKVPDVPTDLTATGTTSTGTVLSWSVSTVISGCDVPGYAVYRNGEPLGTATGPHFTVVGLKPSTTYTFAVAGTDGAGTSAPSKTITVTTAGP
jgi:chitodextrinase